MDILEYWSPNIDWSRFNQGPLSDPMWAYFRDLVQLCHAHKYWQKEWLELMRQKQQDRIRSGRTVRRVSGGRPGKNMGRAALLADEKLNLMRALLKPETTDTPDGKLHLALQLAIKPHPSYGHGHFAAGAFESFDASSELQEAPDKIAERWLSQRPERSTMQLSSG